jgi:F-type H+-transporting ATPase subunit a
VAGPIKQFEISPIAPLHIGGFDVSFTNSALWMVIALVVSSSFLILATRQRAMVPGRLQLMAELLYEFVANMVRENVGPQGRKYFPFVFTIFVFVLMGNMLGMIPYSFTFTSHIAVTAVLALFVFLAVTIFGIFNHGLHFFSLFSPPGVPFLLKLLVVPVEILSFIIRPVTLSVRLAANMIAGHMVLKVFAGFGASMFVAFGATGIFMGTVPMLFTVLVVMLEVLIAFLQAYVFAILTCIYLKDSVELEH